MTDIRAKVDFVLAFAVVHEIPDQARSFRECFSVLKPGGKVLFSEPATHIGEEEFKTSLALARKAGFLVKRTPKIPFGISAMLVKCGSV